MMKVRFNDTWGWLFYVKAFGISLGLMVLGIVWLPTDLWIKGYLVMGIMFVVGPTITLPRPCAMTMRPGV